MGPSIRLGKKLIDNDSLPYIIAEIGVNHEGSVEKAKELIKLAKNSGADAAKFQSYKAETLASKHSPSYWDLRKEPTKSQFDLFKKYDNFSVEDYIELSQYCKKIGIEFLSTPFDEEAIEFLNNLMPFYKIASADITNVPFLRKIAIKNKPIILSTGASSLDEINTAIETIKNVNETVEISLMHCILNYPTPNQDANLNMISSLKRTYPKLIIGYSDHTVPDSEMTTLVTAYVKGAQIIEKHFTYDKSLRGNDHYHAMDFKDLSFFVNKVKKIKILLGNFDTKRPIESENISRRNARRSIVAKVGIKKGEELSEEKITYKRPGTGISPQYWDKVICMKSKENINEDELLNWENLETK